jgi:hypothetical protein
MQDAFVTACVERFEALAGRDHDLTGIERRIFELVDHLRREPQDGPEEIDAIVRRLEDLARKSEAPDTPEPAEQGAPLRRAGVLRRAADLLSGPEKDITPHGVNDVEAKPRG